ncbi:Ig-like domain-containing protein [Vibrio aestuarianus]|uniref:Ig-like domain-containing protein n=1 Tax=Vibrio aestuarianus TaxID=28171 RepID=UPI00237D0706|nr:Ig-like domain-containing protein [Vibrio aestuarianus]MDE1351615.1 Ig-like domain-containing protein [Vibrio aestuarianus]
MQLKAKNSAILVASLVALLSGCGSDSPDNTVTLSKLMISPKSSSFGVSGVQVPVGYSQEFIATAQYSDNTTKDVTDLAVWLSSDQAKAMMDGAILKALEEGNTSVSAKLQGTASANALEVLVTSAVLNEIVISPPVNTVPNGINYSLEVVGNFSDGTGRLLDLEDGDFYSLDPSIADVTVDGQVVTVSPGSATIVIEKDGVTATASVTVTAAELVSINLDSSPTSTPAGLSAQLVATGDYTDETTEDLTNNVEWNSSDLAIAEINNGGLVTPKQTGQVEITATKDGVSTLMPFEVLDEQLVSIEIAPSVESTPKGVTVQLTATASYTDGEDYELTDGSWISSNDSAATVNNGLVTPVAIGSTTITVTKDGISALKPFEVTAAELASIDLEPSTASTVMFQSVQMEARGEFTDGTKLLLSDVFWTSNKSNVALVDPTSGIVTPVALGSTTINAKKDGVTSSTPFVVGADQVEIDDLIFHRPITTLEAQQKGYDSYTNVSESGVNGPKGMIMAAFSYVKAQELCESFASNGHSDWRLPSKAELIKLYDTTNSQGIYKTYGWPQGKESWFLSRGIAYFPEAIDLNTGRIRELDHQTRAYPVCVADKEPMPNIIKINNLTFSRPLYVNEALSKGFAADGQSYSSPNPISKFNWRNGEQLCKNMEFAGKSGWRLPTMAELKTLKSASSEGLGRYWPVDDDYYSSEMDRPGHYYVYDFQYNVTAVVSDNSPDYITCVR